jgi:hypothetical protein
MDFQTLAVRLHERGARPDCVMCGQNNWTAFGEPAQAQIIILIAPTPDGSYVVNHGHASYGYACENCGFIRLHATHAIAPEEAARQDGDASLN